jgi:hypothetical protein
LVYAIIVKAHAFDGSPALLHRIISPLLGLALLVYGIVRIRPLLDLPDADPASAGPSSAYARHFNVVRIACNFPLCLRSAVLRTGLAKGVVILVACSLCSDLCDSGACVVKLDSS